jgi:signal transduction histidine kinase
LTPQKQAEESLRDAHGELETRVRERTRELAKSNVNLSNEVEERKRTQTAYIEFLRRFETSQEEERRRIARELHDQLGQSVAALGLGLRKLAESDQLPQPERQQVRQLEQIVGNVGKEVHDLALELRPTALDDVGLEGALSNHIETWATRTGIAVDFHGLGVESPRLPRDLETAIYRLVQEALTNIVKHASASHVSVIVERRDGQVVAIVEDDGVGFDATAALQKGPASGQLGLLGMRERLGALGGELEIESAAGRGTTVFGRVPIGKS